VASFETDSILRYEGKTGLFVDAFVPSQSGGLNGPDAGIVFGPDGCLYVPSYWTDEVLRYHGSTGAFIDAFVSSGSSAMKRPRTLVFRSDGLLLVSGEGSNGIFRYDRLGNPVDKFITWMKPTGFAISPLDGNVYATSSQFNAVQYFDGSTGKKIDTLVKSGTGGLKAAVYLAFHPDPYLKLSRPDPGVAGEKNSLVVSNATPKGTVLLCIGTQGGSLKVGGVPHGYLGIKDPHLFLFQADGSGSLTLSARVGGDLAAKILYFQVLDPQSNRISNLVIHTF
jgi:DNA-binding beta-propeller fold protein YncE